MSLPPSSPPPLEPLKCVVCEQKGHGVHFGVVTCKPCAAFFRRCIVEKLVYKCIRATNTCNIQRRNRIECKACRMRICRKVGMVYQARINKNLENEDWAHRFMDDADEQHPSLLAKFADSYCTFVGDTQQCPNFSKIVTNYSDYLRIEQNNKKMFLAILNEAVEPFKCMERQAQMELLNNTFFRLKLLHICHLTLEKYPDSGFSNFLMLSNGQILDFNNLGNVLEEWTMELRIKNRSKSALRCSFERIFAFVKMFRSLPEERSCHHDFCALMLLTVCHSAKRLPRAMIELEKWEFYKEKILADWHRDLGSRPASSSADLQMARLLCTLVELDSIANTEAKSQSAEGTCTADLAQSENNFDQQHAAMSLRIHQDISQEAKELSYLVRLVQAHHRVWGAYDETPDCYMDKFGTLEKLFTNPDNILGLHESYTLNPAPFNEKERSRFYREIEQCGAIPMHPRIQKAMVVYKLISVGIMKAIPAFRRISIGDQMLLARFLDQPISFFVNSFYSAQLGANTWVGKDGLRSVDSFRALPHYRDDTQFISWAGKLFSNSVEIHLRYQIPCLEEFALLLAILITHTAVPDLSDHAKDVLYSEQLRYSRHLLRLLQTRLGPAGGACRFAEYMHMLERAFFSAHNFARLIVYQEAFYLRNEFKQFFRKGIQQLFS